jgi:nicotinamidase-related amidase
MSDQEMYRQRGFANRVGFGERCALLIVDLIKAFTDVSCPLGSNLDEEIAATKELLNLFRARALPVHFTTTAYEEGFASGGVFITKVPSLKVLKQNSPLVEIDARLKPVAGEIVWEKKFSMFSAVRSAKARRNFQPPPVTAHRLICSTTARTQRANFFI